MNVLAYGEGEALTGRITADKYAAVAMADILDYCPQVVQELEEYAHGIAAKLNIPRCPAGAYAPIVYELAEVANFPGMHRFLA